MFLAPSLLYSAVPRPPVAVGVDAALAAVDTDETVEIDCAGTVRLAKKIPEHT